MAKKPKTTDGKTKRKSTPSSSAPPPKRRLKKDCPRKDGSDSDFPVDCDPFFWTLDFRQLEQVFRSLNTVYTFCCTRKHFPTTFENLKSSVENLTRRFLHYADLSTKFS